MYCFENTGPLLHETSPVPRIMTNVLLLRPMVSVVSQEGQEALSLFCLKRAAILPHSAGFF